MDQSKSVSYSVHARILPYIEQGGLYQQANMLAPVYSQPNVMVQRVASYICPSELNDQLSSTNPPTYPVCYGAGWGEWFTENYTNGQFGNGAFPGVSYPGQRGLRLPDITDGTSTTVGFADVKAFTAFLAQATLATTASEPSAPTDVAAYGGTFQAARARSSWAVGGTLDTGLTFVFPPNTFVPFTNSSDGKTYDVDWGGGVLVEYNIANARSYHAGGVNAVFLDGSVRFVANSISQGTWRALGSRNGGEPIGDY